MFDPCKRLKTEMHTLRWQICIHSWTQSKTELQKRELLLRSLPSASLQKSDGWIEREEMKRLDGSEKDELILWNKKENNIDLHFFRLVRVYE